MAGIIPKLYAQNSIEFYNRCSKLNRNEMIVLAEYVHTDWTFHAKGIWLKNLKHTEKPLIATVVGSSNFGL